MTSAVTTAIPSRNPISPAHMLGYELESRPSSHGTPIVFVVDDDISVRESLEAMIGCEGWQPETFASAQEFLARPRALVPSCLILDASLPGLNGLDLQKFVSVERPDMPVIFITGIIDVRMVVQAGRSEKIFNYAERNVAYYGPHAAPRSAGAVPPRLALAFTLARPGGPAHP